MYDQTNFDISSMLSSETQVQNVGFDEVFIKNGLVVFGKFNKEKIAKALNLGNRVLVRMVSEETEDNGINLSKNLNHEDLELLRHGRVSVVCADNHRNVYSELREFKDDCTLILKASFANIKMGVILLIRDPKRVAHVQIELLSKLPYLEISEAVDALTPYAIDNFVRKHQTPIMKPIKAGQIGCIFSHVSLWKKLINSKSPAMMIVEDDTTLCEDFQTKLINILIDVPPTFDLLHLYLPDNYHINDNNNDNNDELKLMNDKKVYNFITCDAAIGETCAYIISRNGVRKLLAQLRNGIRETLRKTFIRLVENGIIESYATKESLLNNIGQQECNGIPPPDGILESNTCNSKMYIPHAI